MGKISPVSAKYIINASIQIEGIVDKPDVIGAIFGQTEGLLGSDLELRELQRSGRIGRIEVNLTVKEGKTSGEIIIPSSLDKAETAIVAASLETIQKIGPCDAKVKVEKMDDVRINKRDFILSRAKALLQDLNTNVLPDSQEITNEVSDSVKAMGIKEYGKDRLPAGPGLDESEDIILVEGRADVINLLKHGINNVIGIGGTNVPVSLKELCKEKEVTVFVDGDRGGDLIIKELSGLIDIDFVIKAPDGKEVEELTSKEIFKALRSKVAFNQISPEIKSRRGRINERESFRDRRKEPYKEKKEDTAKPETTEKKEYPVFKRKIEHSDKFKKMLEDLVGTKGSFILDNDLNILGKVPVNELVNTLRSLRNGMFAIVLDGTITRELVYISERTKIKYLVGNDSEVNRARVIIITKKDLE